MPSNQGIRLDDGQRLPPFKEPREQRHAEANRIGRSPWFLLPFQIQDQLLAQKQIFSGERTSARSPFLNTVSTSNNTRREVRKNFASWGRFSMVDKYYMLKRLIFLSDRIFAEHR
jgi:hypothetical protein